MNTVLRLTLATIVLGLIVAWSLPASAPAVTTLNAQKETPTRDPVRRETRQAEKPGAEAPASAPANNLDQLPTSTPDPSMAKTPAPDQSALLSDKIKHIIVIMQENRSFDTYFGTYPGADGIPMQNGVPTVCSEDPQTKQCIKPYHNPEDTNSGGPHGAAPAAADIDGGKMDGFVAQFREAAKGCKGKNVIPPAASKVKHPM
jgi:phospholipase C